MSVCHDNRSLVAILFHRNPNFPTPVAVRWPEYSLESPHILTLTPGMTFSTSVTSNSLLEREKLWKDVLPQLAARAKEQCNEGEDECASQ